MRGHVVRSGLSAHPLEPWVRCVAESSSAAGLCVVGNGAAPGSGDRWIDPSCWVRDDPSPLSVIAIVVRHQSLGAVSVV